MRKERKAQMSNSLPTTPPATPISGKRFAYNHLTLAERAKMGAAIYDQKCPVVGFTLHQVEDLVGAPVAVINKHRNRRPQRASGFTLAKKLAQANAEEFANAR